MATSVELRSLWARYKWAPSNMTRVSFPGDGREWELLVADPLVPAFQIFTRIMLEEDYLFLESAGGTYNPRPIAGTQIPSLHGYGIAVDLNPSKNPHGRPLRHNFPDRFLDRILSIRTGTGLRVFEWGGSWSVPDAMHFEADLGPDELAGSLTYDRAPEEVFDNMLPITTGSPTEDVRALQQLLSVSFSLQLSESGIYDAPTKAAVKTYLGHATNSEAGARGDLVNGRMWVALLAAHIQKVAAPSSSSGLNETQVRAIIDGAPVVGRVEL